MGDDSSGKSESPPKKPTEKETASENTPTTSKSMSVIDRILNSKPPPKPRTRSKSPEIIFTDSDDPDGDMATTKQTSKTPDPPKAASLPSKESEQSTSGVKTTASKDKLSTSTILTPFKPLATSTPKVVKVQAPTGPSRGGPGSYGVPGVVCVKQSAVKGVSMPPVDFYKKYPWLKPTQPSAQRPPALNTTSGSPVSPTKTPGGSQQGSLQKQKSGSQPIRPQLAPQRYASTAPGLRPPGAKPSTPRTPAPNSRSSGDRPSFRSLAQPFNVTKLAGSSPHEHNLEAKASTSGQTENLEKMEPSTEMMKHWKKPWSEMTVEERLEQRKKDLAAMIEIEDREDEKFRLAHPRPPPTTVKPRISRISADVIKRFQETTMRNAALWKEGPSTSAPGKTAASEMLRDILAPVKREPIRGRPSLDPFAPPVKKPVDPFAPVKNVVKKKRMSSLEKKGTIGDQQKSPEKGKSPVKKAGGGGGEGVERPEDDNDFNNDFGDDFGGGGDGEMGGDGTANASSDVIDVGSPMKEVHVKGEKLDPVALKAKNEARRQELLKPAMARIYSEEMAAMAREKAKFEKELMEKISKEQEKKPALPSYSQLQNLKNKPTELNQAMDRLVDNMKRIGSTDESTSSPQGELTKHLNLMMESMKKDVFLGTVRTEVYGAEENMFQEAAVNYVKTSSMTKLSTEDYARGAMVAKIAREAKEKARLRTEQRREEQRRMKIRIVGPKGKITKKELAILTEAQRRRRSLPAPKTPPGSPGGATPPVSTAGSRNHTPERLPPPVTPPGSPPPFGETTKKKVARKRMEVMLNESFDGHFDEDDEQKRKEFSMREKMKERTLKNLQYNYDAALESYEAVKDQKIIPGRLPPTVRSEEMMQWMGDGRRYEWDRKMKELMRLTDADDADNVFDDMDFSSDFPMDDLPSSSKRPSILGRGGQKTPVGGTKPSPMRISRLSMDDPMGEEEEREIRNVVGAVRARDRMLQPLAKGRGMQSRHEEMQQEQQARLQQLQQMRRKEAPMSDAQLKKEIEEYTVLFEDLNRNLAKATQKERDHLINMAVVRSSLILEGMESAMRVGQVLPPLSLSSRPPSSLFSLTPRVLIGDAGGDDDDIVIKSKRTKQRSEVDSAAGDAAAATDPAPTLSPEEGSEAAEKDPTKSRPSSSSAGKGKSGESVEAPPTLAPQQAAAAAQKNRMEQEAAVAAMMDESGRSQVEAVREGLAKNKLDTRIIAERMATLWKMTERAPHHIKVLARRALPTTEFAKARAVIDLRAKIIYVEGMKARRESSLDSNRDFDEFDDTTFGHDQEISIDEPTGSRKEKVQIYGMDKKIRLRKEEELRRAEAIRLAKKREIEEKKKEEEKKKQRDGQRALLGGVVVGLKSGETLTKSTIKLPVDPSIDSTAATKRKVLIRKELSLQERESLILAEFYEYWKANKEKLEKRRVKPIIDGSKVNDTDEDLSNGVLPTVENRPEYGEIEDIEEEDEQREKKIGVEKEKKGMEGEERETGEEQAGTSKSTESAEAVRETDEGETGMKAASDMEPHVKAIYNRWRQMRKHSCEVCLNTGNLVDEVELEEVEVPEGTAEENYEDTRPYQRKIVVMESKKDEIAGKTGTNWKQTVDAADFAYKLKEKQRIDRKKERGEKLTYNERKFLEIFAANSYVSSMSSTSDRPSSSLSKTGLKKQPIKMLNEGMPGRSAEGAKKKVLITRLPGGGTRMRIVRQSDTRPASIEADVRATMDTMLNTICGIAPADPLEVSSDDPPCLDGPWDTVAPSTSERGMVSQRSIVIKKNRVPFGFPTIIRSVRTPGDKSPATTVIWKPEGKHPSTTSAPYHTGKALAGLPYTPKRPTAGFTGSASAPQKKLLELMQKTPVSTPSAPQEKDDVRAVMDEMLRKICGDEEKKKVPSIVWKTVGGKKVAICTATSKPLNVRDTVMKMMKEKEKETTDALPVSETAPKRKEILWKPVDKKTAARLLTPRTPLVTRTAPTPKMRDPVREVVDDMLKIVCAQADAQRVSTVPRTVPKIIRRIVVPVRKRPTTVPKVETTVAKKPAPALMEIGDDDDEVRIVSEKKTGSDVTGESPRESNEPPSDPDDDIVDIEEDDEERGMEKVAESSGRQRLKVMKRRRKQKLEKNLDSDDDEVTITVEQSDEEEANAPRTLADCLSFVNNSDGSAKRALFDELKDKIKTGELKKLDYKSIILHHDDIRLPVFCGEKKKVQLTRLSRGFRLSVTPPASVETDVQAVMDEMLNKICGDAPTSTLESLEETAKKFLKRRSKVTPASLIDAISGKEEFLTLNDESKPLGWADCLELLGSQGKGGMKRKRRRNEPPIILHDDDPIRLPEKKGGNGPKIGEGDGKRMMVTRLSRGGARRKVFRLSAPPASVETDVRAVMDEMLKKICGDEPVGALKSTPSGGVVKKSMKKGPTLTVSLVDLHPGKKEILTLSQDDQLGWVDCLRLVEAQGKGEKTRIRKMKRKMVKAERKWMVVDESTARQFDEKKREEQGLKAREMGGNQNGKRFFTTSTGKRILLKPRSQTGGGMGENQMKKRFFTTSTGKRILLKPRSQNEEGKKGENQIKNRFFITSSGKRITLKGTNAAATPTGPSKAAASAASTPKLRPYNLRLRPMGMPRLMTPEEEVEDEEEMDDGGADEAPDLSAIDDEVMDILSAKPSKRVLQKRIEDRKRRADDSPTREQPPVKKATYRIGNKEKPTPPSTGRSTAAVVAKLTPPTLSRPPPLSPHHQSTPSLPLRTPAARSKAEIEKAEKERQEMLEKAIHQKQLEWEVRKNEAIISRQKAQIEVQKRVLTEVRKHMVDTFENADKTNKLIEKTKRAMYGECSDFAEYRKLVDAREKLMNTLYEQTVEKMKTQVASEENRRRLFENYKRKAVRREKTLIKEIEHTKGQLDKVQEQQLASGLPKKAPSCTVAFTKSTKRSKLNRANYVIEATRRVLGDGVEGDEEAEREQVRAIIEKVQNKFGIEKNMSVEQDRELCSTHEIGYRKRIQMKKFLAKLGLDVFCSQRSFDKMRLEMGEADGTEEVEIPVKREKRMTKKEREIAKKRMIDPREISLGRSGAENDEASDVDIEEILVDDDYNIIEAGNQTGVTDGGETSGAERAERERANRRYNMARFAGTRLLTSDEEYVEESDPDQPGPSNRYIPLPSRYASSSVRLAPLPPSSAAQSHYLHASPILQPVQQMQHMQQGHNARRGRGGARVRGGHNQ